MDKIWYALISSVYSFEDMMAVFEKRLIYLVVLKVLNKQI